jgi:hypothetical protein
LSPPGKEVLTVEVVETGGVEDNFVAVPEEPVGANGRDSELGPALRGTGRAEDVTGEEEERTG